jgi:flagellar hook-associated protein 3 FlgL
MRVSTFGSFQKGLDLMQSLQSMVDRTQRQISSGNRILTPSDDPIAASRTLALRESLSRIDQFERNSDIAKIQLQDEEVTLQSVNDVLQRVRELSLQANNATQSDETRSLIAAELKQHLNQLVQLANQQDGRGRYLFAGNREETTPVTVGAGGYVYNGDDGQREAQIGESRRIATGDSGADVFFRIRAGNGEFVATPLAGNTGTGVVTTSSVVDPTSWDRSQYSVRFTSSTDYEVVDSTSTVIATGVYQPGNSLAFQGVEFTLQGQPAAGDEFAVAPSPNRSMFESVQNIIDAVEFPVTDDVSRAELNNSINRGLEDLDRSIGRVLEVRTRVGSRLAAIENQADTNDAFALTLQQTIGELEDLDYAEALSRLSFELTVLEASQQSFVRTQSLSLFNFL